VSLGPLTFQFSELAKILMIVVLASFLAARGGKLNSIWSIVGACLLVGPPLALVMMQPDLGTSLVFGAIPAGMLWMAGVSLRWLGVLVAGTVAMVPIAWNYLLHDYQKERLLQFMDSNPDIQGAGFQLHQAQIAVGSGGWFGKGLTNGTQTQGGFLPVQATDFVFATLAEELGFLGGIVLFALFTLLLWRVLVSAWRAKDSFGTLFGAGLASMILFQLVVNVGMVLGIMPITGIPLPFVTHGGASLVSMAAGLGILQSINIRQTRAAW
jgi:rod shape determining protein RodA